MNRKEKARKAKFLSVDKVEKAVPACDSRGGGGAFISASLAFIQWKASPFFPRGKYPCYILPESWNYSLTFMRNMLPPVYVSQPLKTFMLQSFVSRIVNVGRKSLVAACNVRRHPSRSVSAWLLLCSFYWLHEIRIQFNNWNFCLSTFSSATGLKKILLLVRLFSFLFLLLKKLLLSCCDELSDWKWTQQSHNNVNRRWVMSHLDLK